MTSSSFQQFQLFQRFQRLQSAWVRFSRAFAWAAPALLCLLYLTLAAHVSPVCAQTPPLPAHRVVVLLVPGLRADDLTRLPLPGLTALRAEGAAGWILCRAARTTDRRLLTPDGRDTPASLSLTLNTGARELAQFPSTNHQPPTTNHQSIGSLVHAQGWKTAVYGNADTDTIQQEGLLLAMDNEGRVDTEQTQSLSDAEARTAPYGRRDDIDLLLRSLTTLSQQNALQVLVFGDLERADRYGPLCLPAQRTAHRLTALRSLDRLLTTLRAQMQAASRPPIRFLLLSPAPAASTETRDRLAPILMWGRDVPKGIVTSPSSRTPGIVVNTDFLPTLAEAWELPPLPGAIGRAFHGQTSPHANTLASWQTAHDLVMQSERLKDVYGGLPTLQMLLVVAAFGLYQRRQRRFACACCAAIVTLPFALLILPSLPFIPQSVWGAGIALAIVILAFAAIAWRLYPSRHGVLLLLTTLFAILLGTITLDLLSGSPLLRHAWMSYSLLEAARFYGIGNEYMGVVIGAACILVGRKEEKKKRRKEEEKTEDGRQKTEENSLSNINSQPSAKFFSSSFLLFFFSSLLFLLAHNHFGAKVGAVPSAGIALGVQGLMLWRGRLRGRDVFYLVGMVALGLGGLLLLDMRHGASEQSHFARAFAGSGGGLFAVASRKLLLEGYLLLHSPWSAALLAASIGFAYFTVGNRKGEKEKRRRGEKETEHRTPNAEHQKLPTISYQLSTIYGLIAGAIASLLCNDSGVTAAAMIMLFGFAWALTQAVDQNRLRSQSRLPIPASEIASLAEANAEETKPHE